MLKSTAPQDGSNQEPWVTAWMGDIVELPNLPWDTAWMGDVVKLPSLQQIILEQGMNSYT